MHTMISIGGEVWASTEATDFVSCGQRSSVYAQITTDTVGPSGNSSPLPARPRGPRRLPESPSLQLSPETKPPPVHDHTPREAVGIGRGTGRSGDGGARGVEPGRAHGVD